MNKTRTHAPTQLPVDKKLPERFTHAGIARKLADALLDEKVGIRHAVLGTGTRWSYHVAEVQSVVAPHVHMHGGEVYYVISGVGVMHTGKVKDERGKYTADWERGRRLTVTTGDAFLIPPKHAHSLENTGSTPIVIAFRCPDNHLTNEDRYLIENRPMYKRHH